LIEPGWQESIFINGIIASIKIDYQKQSAKKCNIQNADKQIEYNLETKPALFPAIEYA
jgi:hypothetical protein